MDAGELVAGRDCGDCTVCCIVPAIDDPDIQKPAATRCRHCARADAAGTTTPGTATISGCAIYDSRPKVCREFYCGWRKLAQLGPAWRPDKSRVFLMIEPVPGPNGAGPVRAVTLMLIGNPLTTVRESWFIAFVRTRALRGLPMFLSLPGKPGFRPVRTFLPLAPFRAAAERGTGPLKTLLETALKVLKADPPPAFVPRHSGNDAGAQP